MSNRDDERGCGDEHRGAAAEPPDAAALARAASFLKAMGDEGRLALLALLARGEACVSELATTLATDVSTVSHRLRVLRSEGLVQRRRAGRHVFYHLEDEHVRHLLEAALDHAAHAKPSKRSD